MSEQEFIIIKYALIGVSIATVIVLTIGKIGSEIIANKKRIARRQRRIERTQQYGLWLDSFHNSMREIEKSFNEM